MEPRPTYRAGFALDITLATHILLTFSTMNSRSKATTSFWAFDAYDCFSNRHYREVSAEAISRVNVLLEAYCLFDKIVVSEGYFSHNTRLFKSIDPSGTIIECIPSHDLIHAETLSPSGITFERSLFERSAEELKKDSRDWFLEHQPGFGKLDLDNDPDGHFASVADSFYLLRLWQWGACKEIAELSGATVLLPNSLRDIENYDGYSQTNDFITRALKQLKEQFANDIGEVVFFTGDPFQDQLTVMPPLFALFADIHKNEISPHESLKTLREEMSDLRDMRRQFETELRGCSSYYEKKELVSGFNSDWKRVCDSGFQKPKLFTSEISGGEVAKAAIDAIDIKVSAGTSVIAKAIEYGQARKAHKRFKAYTRLFDRAGESLLGDDFRKHLTDKFGVQNFPRRTK